MKIVEISNDILVKNPNSCKCVLMYLDTVGIMVRAAVFRSKTNEDLINPLLRSCDLGFDRQNVYYVFGFCWRLLRTYSIQVHGK